MSDEPEPVITERFSKRRADRCAQVVKRIINNWADTNRLDFRCVMDETPDGKSFDDLAKMYFEVGTGNNLVSLPFIDLLFTLELLRQQADRPRGATEFKSQVKTSWTKTEALALFNGFRREYQFEVRERPYGAPDTSR